MNEIKAGQPAGRVLVSGERIDFASGVRVGMSLSSLLILISNHELAHELLILEAVEVFPVIMEYFQLDSFAGRKYQLAMALADKLQTLLSNGHLHNTSLTGENNYQGLKSRRNNHPSPIL